MQSSKLHTLSLLLLQQHTLLANRLDGKRQLNSTTHPESMLWFSGRKQIDAGWITCPVLRGLTDRRAGGQPVCRVQNSVVRDVFLMDWIWFDTLSIAHECCWWYTRQFSYSYHKRIVWKLHQWSEQNGHTYLLLFLRRLLVAYIVLKWFMSYMLLVVVLFTGHWYQWPVTSCHNEMWTSIWYDTKEAGLLLPLGCRLSSNSTHSHTLHTQTGDKSVEQLLLGWVSRCCLCFSLSLLFSLTTHREKRATARSSSRSKEYAYVCSS